jgi:uncharacterized membrane protein YciS (DUF1049 family)
MKMFVLTVLSIVSGTFLLVSLSYLVALGNWQISSSADELVAAGISIAIILLLAYWGLSQTGLLRRISARLRNGVKSG